VQFLWKAPASVPVSRENNTFPLDLVVDFLLLGRRRYSAGELPELGSVKPIEGEDT
jgi:hypothetical protein